MTIRLLLFAGLLTFTACDGTRGGGSGGAGDDDDDAAVSEGLLTMTTSMGDVGIQIYVEDAPDTAANFLQYLDDGFYDGGDGDGATVFHRVIPDFMIQGGGFRGDGTQKTTRDPIVNEARENDLLNVRGTLSMAQTSQPNSGTSQFFINVVANTHLDPTDAFAGHAVFGEVTYGMDVVDAISLTPRDGSDRPVAGVVIESFTRD